MVWKEKQAQKLVSNIIPITVNPCSHQGSCCKACFWYTKPKENKKKQHILSFKYTSFVAIPVFGCQWSCAKMLYLLVTGQEPVGKSRACVHACIIHLTEPIFSCSLFLSVCFFSFSSIRTSKLPFRPQKYDIWCSNDLQTISGNVHHESWKCIFPFPLWRRLHAHRKIYTAVAFSFSALLSVSWILPLCCDDCLLLPINFPVHAMYNSPCFGISYLPIKAHQSPAMYMSWTDVNI